MMEMHDSIYLIVRDFLREKWLWYLRKLLIKLKNSVWDLKWSKIRIDLSINWSRTHFNILITKKEM